MVSEIALTWLSFKRVIAFRTCSLERSLLDEDYDLEVCGLMMSFMNVSMRSLLSRSAEYVKDDFCRVS